MTGEAALVLLGIAQDGGHPQAGCQRPCCAGRFLPGGVRDRVVSLGIQAAGKRFLVDCTPDFPSQLADLAGLDGIFLTHAHSGHYTGLLNLGPEAWAPTGVPIYAMPGMAAFLRNNAPWCSLFDEGHTVLYPLEDGVAVDLGGGVTVTPRCVPDRGPWSETVAFVIAGARHRVLYLPDVDRWSSWEAEAIALVASVDRAYLDGSFFSWDEVGWRDPATVSHPTITDTLAQFADLAQAGRTDLAFIHLNHTNPALDSYSDAARAVRAAGFRVASDGERFAL